MKIKVDNELCEAHGECVIAAPEIFELGDDDEIVTVLDSEPSEDLRGKAEEAAQMCPVSAITVED